jgi:thiamine-phosphate pyrophosphorylase
MYNKLQYISQGDTSQEQIENISRALDAGCQWIQLRFKHATEEERFDVARKIKLKCEDYKATFIVNDHVELALEVDADGVHLGLNDTAIDAARIFLGRDKIIGGTANTIQDVLKRVEEKCDYVGLGPFRFTTTKEKLSPVLGVSGYAAIMRELNIHNIRMPVYAIGGIKPGDVEALMDSGVYGIAVSGMITHHPSQKQLIEQLNTMLYATI